MQTYISLLRGINVSGQKKIKMLELRKAFEGLGFVNVRTYVQSGNLVFKAKETEPAELETKISEMIRRVFGFEVAVIVLGAYQLKTIVEHNPFVSQPGKDPAFIGITFLAGKPELSKKEDVISKKHADEDVCFTDEAIYLYCPNGFGRTRLNNNFLESKLKVTASSRNWKTCRELLRLAMMPISE